MAVDARVAAVKAPAALHAESATPSDETAPTRPKLGNAPSDETVPPSSAVVSTSSSSVPNLSILGTAVVTFS